MTLVLVDLDGTLLPGGGSERRLASLLLRSGRIGLRQGTAFLAFALRHLPRHGRDTWKKNKAYLHALPVAEVERAAARFAEENLLPALCPRLCARLQEHALQGDRVVLLTGTLKCLADPLAVLLGLDGACATICSTDKGVYSGALPRVHPYGPEKLRLAAELCRRYGARIGESTAYADSTADIPLLAAVGRPVAVRPEAGLLFEARRRGWEIFD